ncbi:thiamine-phosphate kinase [Ahniella affigens]|uniref:Thiamine-monophosphate kinase n=2 Tax=Ahniella affigens TaxID=2021234 RepID=A0A2P1PZG0_9GAMM|nr:thiamine-phosphate kinase [Ahniella affigens]
MREFELIDWIRQLPGPSRPDVLTGIGDDAAVLSVPAGFDLIVSTDTSVAGVHFPHGTAAYDVGWKSLAVNLSDLAAMGATPAWVSLALTLPKLDADWLKGFFAGFQALALPHRLALIGGDTTRGPLAITITIHGFCPNGQAVRRRGARAGDALIRIGRLGLAAAGLRWQLARPESERASPLLDPFEQQCLQALNRPEPKIGMDAVLRTHASALIDVSDGLLADLMHVARSSGVGAKVDLDAIEEFGWLSEHFGSSEARDMVTRGGDDYALLAACAPAQVDLLLVAAKALGHAASVIGCFEAEPGCRIHHHGQIDTVGGPSGYEHFT